MVVENSCISTVRQYTQREGAEGEVGCHKKTEPLSQVGGLLQRIFIS